MKCRLRIKARIVCRGLHSPHPARASRSEPTLIGYLGAESVDHFFVKSSQTQSVTQTHHRYELRIRWVPHLKLQVFARRIEVNSLHSTDLDVIRQRCRSIGHEKQAIRRLAICARDRHRECTTLTRRIVDRPIVRPDKREQKVRNESKWPGWAHHCGREGRGVKRKWTRAGEG